MSVGTIGRIGQLFRSSSLTSLAYVDLWFSNSTYVVNGSVHAALGSIPGFTFTRASLAMGYDATGKLTYGPNNLCLQSQALGTSPWGAQAAGAGATPVLTNNYAAAPDGTMTATRVQVSLNGGTATADQSYPVQGCTCPTARGSFYVKTNDGSTKTIYVRGSFAATKVATGTWTRIDFEAGTLSSTQFGIGLRGGQSPACSDTADLLVWGAQLEAVTYQTTPSTYYPTTTAAYYGPRLVYDPVTLASQGILVEEARTNIALYSQTFDAAQWGRNEGALTNNATTAPDGTSTASSFIPTAGAVTLSNTSISPTLTDSVVYTASCFLKKNGYDWAKVILRSKDSASETGAWFNLNTGAVGTVDAGITAAIQSVGSGWYRCSVVKNAGTGATSPRFRIASTNADNVLAFTANGTSGLFIYQAQLEAGTGASSPIPTTTAAVTRAADAASVTGLSVPNPHSMAAEWTPGFDNGTSFRRTGALTNSGATSDDTIYQRHTNNFSRMYTTADMDLLLGTANATTANKAAARFELNNGAGSLNGAATVAPDTSTTPTTGIDRLLIGVGSLSTGPLNGTVSRIRIYNRALSDAQLQALTS
jgi:hypothetical protein